MWYSSAYCIKYVIWHAGMLHTYAIGIVWVSNTVWKRKKLHSFKIRPSTNITLSAKQKAKNSRLLWESRSETLLYTFFISILGHVTAYSIIFNHLDPFLCAVPLWNWHITKYEQSSKSNKYTLFLVSISPVS